ncbi:hypothetical protein JRI60_20615 [Archangium violaceum]|uniref:hypothetical protein n=1 Tax=Archangium violaceum TaxID=83451 RepID=UPI0019500A36|nr:hypothetical protein [Archangium violaceum]QRO01256.1 hypothetical protein JRI60_20615 [Archangium violaceum]
MAQELARRPDAARSYRITLHFDEQLLAERDKSRFDPAPSKALSNCLHHHLMYKAYEAMSTAMGDAPKGGPVDVTVTLSFANVKPAEKLDDRFY